MTKPQTGLIVSKHFNSILSPYRWYLYSSTELSITRQ